MIIDQSINRTLMKVTVSKGSTLFQLFANQLQLSSLLHLQNSTISSIFACKAKIAFKPFMHDVEKWSNILWKCFGVHTARFFKYVWPFFNIMHERLINQHENSSRINLGSRSVKVSKERADKNPGTAILVPKQITFVHSEKPANIVQTSGQSSPQSFLFQRYTDI